MKLFVGDDSQANTKKLMELAKQDENGLFVARDLRSVQAVKESCPELSTRMFLGSTLFHARGRKETNLYVDDLLNNRVDLSQAPEFQITAASITTDEHESVAGDSPFHEQTDGEVYDAGMMLIDEPAEHQETKDQQETHEEHAGTQ